MTETQTLHLTQPALTDPVDHGPLAGNAAALDAALRAAQEALGTKADASALTALETVVGGKADASDLSALQSTVSGKADAAATTAALAAKADASALSPITAALAALGGVPEGAHNLLVYYGEYDAPPTVNGNSVYGRDYPISLTLPFRPLLVMVERKGIGSNPEPLWMMRPFTKGSLGSATVTWRDDGVSWYAGNASDQKSSVFYSYFYYAFGWSV